MPDRVRLTCCEERHSHASGAGSAKPPQSPGPAFPALSLGNHRMKVGRRFRHFARSGSWDPQHKQPDSAVAGKWTETSRVYIL